MNKKENDIKILCNEYQVIDKFTKKHTKFTYLQFDNYLIKELTLFMVDPDIDYDTLENKIDEIIKRLPAIKSIFVHPLLHLKENEEVLPIESVRGINQSSIIHIASHSELWDDLTNDGIKPVKLLTKTYNDNYSIYENRVFCNTIDDILDFIKENNRYLKEYIYSNQIIEFNILERKNHMNYFLALGKLHTGYIRNFSKYYDVTKRCINKLSYLENIITSRLHLPIYQKNKNLKEHLPLRKTNILGMHKDYHQIYVLQKEILNKNFLVDDFKMEMAIDFDKNYFDFVKLLTIFSIGHFNFSCNENTIIELNNLNLLFNFKKWNLHFYSSQINDCDLLIIEISKEFLYKIVLIPSVFKGQNKIYENIKEKTSANECLFVVPYEDSQGLFVSISNIESFRRIEQLLLRGMVYSDYRRTDCPFCYGNLEKEENYFICRSCQMQIVDTFCKVKQHEYSYTKMFNYKLKNIKTNDNDWLSKRKNESQMFYRNITNITANLDIICPCCGEIHNPEEKK